MLAMTCDQVLEKPGDSRRCRACMNYMHSSRFQHILREDIRTYSYAPKPEAHNQISLKLSTKNEFLCPVTRNSSTPSKEKQEIRNRVYRKP